MAFSHGAARTHSKAARSSDFDLSSGDGDWPEEPHRSRDWKKLVLVIGLGTLSWVATYIGMLELIESNMGDLPLAHKAVIGFSVAMLMTMIIWLLDQMFAPIPTATKLAYVGGYIFLTLISVGFGFGFYWKVLESRSESSRSAESAVTQVQSSLHAASTRMVQLSATLDQLNEISRQKAELERTKGSSCPDSRPGDGPRRKLRDDDAQRFAFAADFVRARVDGVKSDLAALDGDLAKVVAGDKSTFDQATGTRNDFMRALSRKLDITVTGFNAFRTDPQLKQLRADLGERAEKTIFPDSRGRTFSCPDPQLQQALKGVVRAIDQLPNLEKPKIAAVEGSEATIEAFRRLTATFYGALSFKLPPSADELRELQKKAVQSVEASPAVVKALASEPVVGLSKRDYIPLAIAVFVDLCLLLVSMGRPINRLHGLVPKMRAAERGPVIQILSRFNEIHRDDEIRKNFEVFRHVVFDFHGAYYVAVPLDAPYKPNGPYTHSTSTDDIEDLKHEAHLLANLFTSFEKESIFSRVYSPLLTTRAIKKKLHRQGSKFANAEAFRVYRFRDGAWSEIILGAVMGAARRVEAEKKKRRLEQQLFSSHEPTLAPANDTTQPGQMLGSIASTDQQTNVPSVETPALHTVANVASASPAGGSDGFFARRAAAREADGTAETQADSRKLATSRDDTGPADAADPGTIAEFGPYAARASREIAKERYRATLPTLRGADGALDRPRSRRRTERNIRDDAGDEDTPAGEVVLFAIPGDGGESRATAETRAGSVDGARETRAVPIAKLDEAGPHGIAASPASPTAPDGEVMVAAGAMAGSPAQVPERRIGVVLRRETAEFTLPVTEATLPGALLRGQFDLIGGSPSEVDQQPLLPHPEAIQTAVPVSETAPADTTNATAEDEPTLFTEPDIEIRVDDISRRFRPSAAE
ncbi:MAG: hypothetical protein AB7U75_09430 [Hyphomicrobiaceae bacterium]